MRDPAYPCERPRPRWIVIAALLCVADPAAAIPPLISGDVPTAPRGTCEFFVGHILRDDGEVETQEVPFWELVYGLSERQEVTIEVPVVVREDANGTATGLGDAVIGTKLRLLGEPAADAGLSVSLEIKLPTGDPDRGLGSGATDVDLRARWGWQVRSEVVYINLGHSWVGERDGESLDDTWFYATVWDHPLGRAVRLLTEIYCRTADESDAPNRLAATTGFKWKARPGQQFQFSVGRSVRSDAKGGPKLRVYSGWRWDF